MVSLRTTEQRELGVVKVQGQMFRLTGKRICKGTEVGKNMTNVQEMGRNRVS